MNDEVINCEAIYGMKTKKALVKITFRSETVILDTEDAKRFAYDLLDVAHAADGDAFIMHWAQHIVGMNEKRAAEMLKMFREHRVRMNGES